MATITPSDEDTVVQGGHGVDTVQTGAGDDTVFLGGADDVASTNAGNDHIDGEGGSDTLDGGVGNDLVAGGNAGSGWSLVDGHWVYNAANVNTADDPNYHIDTNDNILVGDLGEDVLLGASGRDDMYGGDGNDIANGGAGNDRGFGGAGADLLNLEAGNDYAEGGSGADIVNAGSGDDVVYGDDRNLLQGAEGSETNFAQFANNENWAVEQAGDDDLCSMSQTIETVEGETYTLSFNLAANLAGGATSGTMEVRWNGEVIDTISTDSGVFESYSVDITGTGEPGELSFHNVPNPDSFESTQINTDGLIYSYESTMTIQGEEVTVAAFAPGQASLYQVIDGELHVFDTETGDYSSAGDPTGLKINALGFNVEDDLLYGVAKQDGFDCLGNPVTSPDIVVIDAQGNAYRVGDAPHGDYVGDFDDEGNLWTFNASLNRMTCIDVNNLDADGNPVVTNYDLPDSMLNDKIYDIAYNSTDGVFYGVVSPDQNGGTGSVVQFDVSSVVDGGEPEITEFDISGTLIDGQMVDGMVKGAYGAVFIDGEGNLYAGLNKGDHDLDGSTAADGGIYSITIDPSSGQAYAELMSDAPATGTNDGAADPRSMDAFAEVDTSATIQISDPVMTSHSGGDDDLRGGTGDDEMHGGGGNDLLHGAEDDDDLYGDAGNDQIFGGSGDDSLKGGEGADHLDGGSENDVIDGGQGNDFILGQSGDDTLSGGAGVDKIVGGSGEDRIEGGAGNDNMWGGNWSADGSSDTFVVSAGGGKDMIHDFEVDHDVVDLSAYGLEYADLESLISDKGWATEIDLSGLDGGASDDKLILKSVDMDDLDETNFIL